MTFDAWESAARRGIFGPKTKLNTISDDSQEFFITPRKYSEEGKAEIQRLSLEQTNAIPASVLGKLARLQEGGVSDMSELQNKLTDDEYAEILKGQQAGGSSVEVMAAQLFYGVGKHNLTKDANEIEGIDKKVIVRILEFPELTAEVLAIVEGWNSPLAQSTGTISPTSSNGSTGKAGSSSGSPSPSQMDESENLPD